MNLDKFEIRFDLICNDFMSIANWRSLDVSDLMAKELHSRGIWKRYQDLFQDLVASEDVIDDHYPEIIRNNDSKEMKKQLLCDLYCDAGHFYYLNEIGWGANFYQKISLGIDHKDFKIFFAFRLIRCSHKTEFLDYHFEQSFDKDKRIFLLHLNEIKKILPDSEREFIDVYLSNPAKITRPIKHQLAKGEENNFSFYFKDVDKLLPILKDYLFDHSGNVKGTNKGKLITDMATAIKKRIDIIDNQKYTGTKLSSIIHNEFGEKLGNKSETIRDYITPAKLKENKASLELFNKISNIS